MVPHVTNSPNGETVNNQIIRQINMNITKREKFMLTADNRNYSMNGIIAVWKNTKKGLGEYEDTEGAVYRWNHPSDSTGEVYQLPYIEEGGRR